MCYVLSVSLGVASGCSCFSVGHRPGGLAHPDVTASRGFTSRAIHTSLQSRSPALLPFRRQSWRTLWETRRHYIMHRQQPTMCTKCRVTPLQRTPQPTRDSFTVSSTTAVRSATRRFRGDQPIRVSWLVCNHPPGVGWFTLWATRSCPGISVSPASLISAFPASRSVSARAAWRAFVQWRPSTHRCVFMRAHNGRLPEHH